MKISCLTWRHMVLLFADVSEECIAFIHSAVLVSKTSVNIYQAMLHHIPEDRNLHSSRCRSPIPAFAWKDLRKPRKICNYIRWSAEIRTANNPNKSQKHYL